VILYREQREGSAPREDSLPYLSAPGSRRGSSLPQLPITANTQCSMDEVGYSLDYIRRDEILFLVASWNCKVF